MVTLLNAVPVFTREIPLLKMALLCTKEQNYWKKKFLNLMILD